MSKLLGNYCAPSASASRSDLKNQNLRPKQFTSSLADLCRLLQIPAARAATNTSFSFRHVQFKAKQKIYTAGQAFDALYVVNSGFVKTTLPDDDGHEQVLGFPMKGELLGTDGIHQQKYATSAIALSHCDFVMVPFEALRSLSKVFPEIEMAIYSIMSRELIRNQRQLNVLGSQKAEVRVARFLTSMSERFSQLGYSDKEFKLHMTRHEIANYLGLSLETVSRSFSAFNQLDFIAIEGRSISLRQAQKLKTLRRLPPLNAATKNYARQEDRVSSQSLVQPGIEDAIHYSTRRIPTPCDRPSARG